jgi:hypothetical protein
VRPEYRKLAEDLPVLARVFGAPLPAQARHDLLTFTLALECIDRHLDAIAAADGRARFGVGLLGALRGGPAFGDAELVGQVGALRALLERTGTVERFCAIGEAALDNTERMRVTRSPSEYLGCVRREGRYTVELALLFVGEWLAPGCRAFLRSVAEMGNLVDKLKDARGDFARGEMAVTPGVALHARLVGLILQRVPAAAVLHPSLPGFVRWSVSYL